MKTNKRVPGGSRITSWTKWRDAFASSLPLLVAASVAAQSVATDNLQRLYEDKAKLEKLSGATRNSLEARFGERILPTKTEPHPEPPGNSDSPINNNLITGTDTSAQDTQSETTLALGTGATVVSAFNDSGSFVGGAAHFTGYAISTDGGVTWTDKGTLPASSEGDAGDPVLAHALAVGALPDTIYMSTLGF
ncbi:MAG: hypothetical protein HY043_20065, partial [Verrucomicrobia bacterium]|nr:hypothetical protein [Verrucomicrobiota bacterium]